jgi:hypothetical protein
MLLTWIFPLHASAVQISNNALRLQDEKNGTLVLGADQAIIEQGERFRTVLLVWGKLDVYGEIEEFVLLSGQVVFHPGAKVTKSLVVLGGQFESKPGADVAAEKVVFQAPGPMWNLLKSAGALWRDYYAGALRWIGAASLCLITWLLGLLVFASFPTLQKNTEGRLSKEWGANLLTGLLATIFTPALFVLLLISIIGIFALPIYFLLLFASGALAYAAAGLWAGHRLLPPKGNRRINPSGFLLGLAVLQFLWTCDVAWASVPAMLLWLLGWGAVVRSLRALWR